MKRIVNKIVSTVSVIIILYRRAIIHIMKGLKLGAIGLGIIILLLQVGCGSEESCKPVDYICKKCTTDKDCCGNICETLYDLNTGRPLGKYCIDTYDRVCRVD